MKHIIKMDVIKAKVLLLVGDYEDIKKYIPVNLSCIDGEDYLARTAYKKKSNCKHPFHVVIHSKSAAISVIAHEAVHAASFILNGMGVYADFDNDEIQAYIVQHICETAENILGTYDK